MRTNHKVTALSLCVVILASVFAAACTDPSQQRAADPSSSRVRESRDR